MSMSATKIYRTSKRTCFFLWLTQYDQNDLNKKSKPRPKTTNGDKPQYEWAYHYIWSAQNLGIKWMFKKVITKSVPQSAHSKQYYVISLSTGHQTIWLFIGYVEPLWYDIWWCSSLWLGIFIQIGLIMLCWHTKLYIGQFEEWHGVCSLSHYDTYDCRIEEICREWLFCFYVGSNARILGWRRPRIRGVPCT